MRYDVLSCLLFVSFEGVTEDRIEIGVRETHNRALRYSVKVGWWFGLKLDRECLKQDLGV